MPYILAVLFGINKARQENRKQKYIEPLTEYSSGLTGKFMNINETSGHKLTGSR